MDYSKWCAFEPAWSNSLVLVSFFAWLATEEAEKALAESTHETTENKE